MVEFADLAEGYGAFLQILNWIKFELIEAEEGLFNYLARSPEI
jgi:hypothetical protein